MCSFRSHREQAEDRHTAHGEQAGDRHTAHGEQAEDRHTAHREQAGDGHSPQRKEGVSGSRSNGGIRARRSALEGLTILPCVLST